MLDRNLDVNEADDRGWTPLMHAAKTGNCVIAEALMSLGNEVEAARCNHLGHSAIDIARFYRCKDVYTLLTNFSMFTSALMCFLILL